MKKQTAYYASITLIVITVVLLTMSGAIAVSKKDIDSPPAASGAAAQYMLKEYGGQIGVYTDGSGIPSQVLEVQVKGLPQEDQERLSEGIFVPTLEQLYKLIEDYDS